MKFKNPLLVVKDLKKTIEFYQKVLGLYVILDFGENITMTGNISFQTQKSWTKLIGKEDFLYQTNTSELYFEENDFDQFLQKLQEMKEICYVHPVFEHPWGQRAIRFYDLDGHMIEVGESITIVVKHFLTQGLTQEQTAQRMDVPLEFIKECQK